jgi:hypothetical protein
MRSPRPTLCAPRRQHAGEHGQVEEEWPAVSRTVPRRSPGPHSRSQRRWCSRRSSASDGDPAGRRPTMVAPAVINSTSRRQADARPTTGRPSRAATRVRPGSCGRPGGPVADGAGRGHARGDVDGRHLVGWHRQREPVPGEVVRVGIRAPTAGSPGRARRRRAAGPAAGRPSGRRPPRSPTTRASSWHRRPRPTDPDRAPPGGRGDGEFEAQPVRRRHG